MNKINLYNELCEEGYKVVLISSFTNDLVLFERMFLSRLLANDCTYIGLFLDNKNLRDVFVQSNNILELGKSYAVKGIELKSAFHPKVFLMLGDNKAKVIVGSGNLTASGVITNIEVFNVFRFDNNNENSTNLSLIVSALGMFRHFNQKNPSNSMKSIFEKISEFEYLKKATSNSNIYFADNSQKPLYEQIIDKIDEDIVSIDIIAPFFDSELKVIKKLIDDHNQTKIRVLLQNNTTNFPFEKAAKLSIEYKEIHFKNEEEKRRYHGKIFCIKNASYELIVYGSANCSKQALLEIPEKYGNAEAVIIEKMPLGSIDKFIEGEFDIKDIVDTLNTIDNSDNDVVKDIPIIFEDALKENGKFIIIIKIKNKVEVQKVLITGKPAKLEQNNDRITAIWQEEFSDLPQVFNFEVQTKEKDYIIAGWYHNFELLLRNQLKMEKSIYSRIKDDPDISDFKNIIDLLEVLLKQLVLDDNSIQDKNIKRDIQSIALEKSELSEEENISNNIEDYYISEAELNIYKYGSVKGNDFLSELINQLLATFSNNTKTVNERQQKNPGSGKITINTAEELEALKIISKKMNIFIKKFNSGLTSSRYLEQVPQEVLIKNIVVYSEFLIKLCATKLFKPIMNKYEFIVEWIKIIEGLCKYAEKNIMDHEYIRSYILPYSLAIIILKDQNIYKTDSREERKSIGKLLEDIDKYIEPIREDYKKYIEFVADILNKLDFEIVEENDLIGKRINKLFSYLTLKQFKEYLKNTYDNLYNLDTDKAELTINEDIKLGVRFNIDKLSLLKKLVTVSDWKDKTNFKIVIRNTTNNEYKTRVILDFNKKSKILIRSIYYRNGKTFSEVKHNVSIVNIKDADGSGNYQFMVQGFKEIK